MARESYLSAEDPQVDLSVLRAMADELEAYLIDDELYRTLIVHTPTGDQSLKMTIGDMLTRLHRLQRGGADAEGLEEEVAKIAAQIEQTSRELHTRMQERMVREIASRLNSLKWFLDDCEESQQRCRIEFPFEMRNRQRIEELLSALDGEVDEALRQRIETVDEKIRQITKSADFLWDERLKPAFPRDPYWYLYLLP